MKDSISKYFDIVPMGIQNVWAIISKTDRSIMVQFKISPVASTVRNMELSMNFIEVYEAYCRAVQRELY